MKMLKLLFSRFPILLCALSLQVAALSLVLLLYRQYFVWFEAASLLLSLAVLLHMLNRDTPPEFKLPWLMILTVFPILGASLYVFLANPKLRKRQSRTLAELEETRKQYLEASREYREAMHGTLGEYTGIERYLNETAYSHGFLNNRVEYYGEGNLFFDALCRALEEAEHFIFLEYFIIEHGLLWQRIHDILLRKHLAGVEVRILYDDFGTLGKLSAGYARRLSEEGLATRRFNRLRPVLSGIYNYRDHRKIAVVDGRVGFTGGMNLGDEYAGISRPLGRWKDAGLAIEGAAVGNLTFLFLQLWDTAGPVGQEDRAAYFLPIPTLDGTGGYVHAFGCGPAPFYREAVAENTFINLIGASRRRVYITTPYLIIDRTLTVALCNAARRGVDVRIVTPHIPDKRLVFLLTRASYRTLLAAGVRIFEYTPGFIHAKEMLVDDEIAFVGTVNMDYRSLSHHFECGAILCRTPALSDIAADFAGVLAVSQEITRGTFRQNPVARLLAALLKIFSPLF